MKYLFEPVNLTQLVKFLKNPQITDLLIGIEDLTPGFILKLSVAKVNQYLTRKNQGKISLKITRIFHETELETLEETLKSIKLENVKFIFYSDLAVYQILRAMGYANKLVYDAYTYTTNLLDCNLYSQFNRYITISNQISFDELNAILNQMSTPAIIYGFGKSIIFYSRRPLLKNYFLYRKQEYDEHAKNYYLQEEFRKGKHHLYEDLNGTYLYEENFYYLFSELTQLKMVDYAIIESVDLNSKTYDLVVDAYLNKRFAILEQAHLPLYKGMLLEKSILLKGDGLLDE